MEIYEYADLIGAIINESKKLEDSITYFFPKSSAAQVKISKLENGLWQLEIFYGTEDRYTFWRDFETLDDLRHFITGARMITAICAGKEL